MRKRMTIGLVALVLIAAIAAVSAAVGRTIAPVKVKSAVKMVVKTRPLTASDQNAKWFGPWERLKDYADYRYAGVALLRRNGNEFVSREIRLDTTGWHQAVLPTVGVVDFEHGEMGQIDLGYDGQADYTVGWDQPFILEQYPTRMYAFRQTSWGYIVVSRSTKRAHSEKEW